MKVRCEANRVEWEGAGFDVHIAATQALKLEDRVIVIHDYMAYPLNKAAPNLVAYSLTDELLWVAENPGKGATDAYTNFISESPLIVGNFAGFNCTIETITGRLLHAEFTK
jgi:hypothetical protein